MTHRVEVNTQTGEAKIVQYTAEEQLAHDAAVAAEQAEAARQAMQSEIDAATTVNEIKAAMP